MVKLYGHTIVKDTVGHYRLGDADGNPVSGPFRTYDFGKLKAWTRLNPVPGWGSERSRKAAKTTAKRAKAKAYRRKKKGRGKADHDRWACGCGCCCEWRAENHDRQYLEPKARVAEPRRRSGDPSVGALMVRIGMAHALASLPSASLRSGHWERE